MRLLGVVGLTALDRVDGGPPRVGGAAFYAAQAFRALGECAVVATKFAPADEALVAPLRRLGLPVEARPAASTITFAIDNRENEERAMDIEAPPDPWTPEEARGWLTGTLARVGWLHAGALTRADFPAATLAVLARGRVVSLDGQALVRPARLGRLVPDADYDPEVLRHLRILKLSAAEAEALGLEQGEAALRALGVREVIVTLGPQGALVCANRTFAHVPTRPLVGIDPTGAGDFWAAAYLSFRSRGHAPVSAARLANGTASALLLQRHAA
jgi:sugar/nucleoside kinase (ribokinase family)